MAGETAAKKVGGTLAGNGDSCATISAYFILVGHKGMYMSYIAPAFRGQSVWQWEQGKIKQG